MKNIILELNVLLRNKIVAGLGIFGLACIMCTSHTNRTNDSGDVKDTKVIEVTGSSEMSVVPDEIEFVIGINEYYNGSLSPKKDIAQLNKVENEVKEKLIALGVKKESIKTELFVNSYWYWSDTRHTNMSKQLKFCVNDVSIINKFVSDIDIKGLEYMRMGELSHKKILEYRKQVKMDALKAAKEKAGYLLESIGKKTGEVIKITELPERSSDGWGYYYPQYYSNSNMISNASSYSSGSADAGGNSEVRTIKLRYEVQTTFQILN